mmetsp:Transcript_45587/g.81535  ORF Transcript_45587/g.81535 Transcript_45587/m.81535 type:complete len:310 (-) Transcript_45587:620-1549(-)
MTPMHVRSFCINYVRRLVRPTCARTYASKRVEEVTTPKTKLTAYSLFVKDKFKYVEGIDFGEKSRALALTWSNMSKEEKQVFVERAGKENESRPSRARQVTTPKTKLTAYSLFTKDKFKYVEGIDFGEKTRALALTWSNMSKEEKQVFVERAGKENESRPSRARQERLKILTGFDLFRQEQTQTESAQHLGAMWAGMSTLDKQVLTQRAAHLNTEQQRTPPPSPLTQLPQNAMKPKRHLTPYNLFMKEYLTTAPGTTQQQKIKAAGAEWKMIDKAPYVAQAKTLMMNPAKEGQNVKKKNVKNVKKKDVT